MANWKDNADRLIREDKEKRDRENQRQYQEKFDEHMSRFKCHICGKPSDGPRGQSFESPTGLTSCLGCRQWVCDDHIKADKCKSCWEGFLAGKSYYERATVKRGAFSGALFLLSFLLLSSGSYFFGVVAMLFAIGWAWSALIASNS